MAQALQLRERMLASEGFTFDVTVTSDYGTYLHSFVLRCSADANGKTTFEVIAPDSISGITGWIDDDGGKLTFDEEILVFSPLADGQISPVTAPWILIRTLLGGYITSCANTEGGLELTIDDSYADDALSLMIRLDKELNPCSAEIIWQNRRILSMRVENFRIL